MIGSARDRRWLRAPPGPRLPRQHASNADHALNYGKWRVAPGATADGCCRGRVNRPGSGSVGMPRLEMSSSRAVPPPVAIGPRR